jgi:predicted histone-like DNA-binding protein
MINYKLYQNSTQGSKSFGKWYCRAVVNRTFGVADLAEHMARHNTPFSAGSIKGILTDAVSCIKELVMDGTAVKLDDLAIFSIGIRSTGADKAEDFNVEKNVKDVHLRARATGKLSTSHIGLEKKLKELDNYQAPKASTTDTDTGDGAPTTKP